MSRQQAPQTDDLMVALSTLNAQRQRDLQEAELIRGARTRWSRLRHALMEAESLGGEKDETDEQFVLRWAPHWRNVASLVNEQFGAKASEGITIDDDLAFGVAHALFAAALQSPSEAEFHRSLLVAGQSVANANRGFHLRIYLARLREHLYSKVKDSLRLDVLSLNHEGGVRSPEEPPAQSRPAPARRACPDPNPEALASGIAKLHGTRPAIPSGRRVEADARLRA